MIPKRSYLYRRVVAKENPVAFQGAVLSLPSRSPFVSWAYTAVEVHVRLEGSGEMVVHHDRLAHFDTQTARTVGL